MRITKVTEMTKVGHVELKNGIRAYCIGMCVKGELKDEELKEFEEYILAYSPEKQKKCENCGREIMIRKEIIHNSVPFIKCFDDRNDSRTVKLNTICDQDCKECEAILVEDQEVWT